MFGRNARRCFSSARWCVSTWVSAAGHTARGSTKYQKQDRTCRCRVRKTLPQSKQVVHPETERDGSRASYVHPLAATLSDRKHRLAPGPKPLGLSIAVEAQASVPQVLRGKPFPVSIERVKGDGKGTF